MQPVTNLPLTLEGGWTLLIEYHTDIDPPIYTVDYTREDDVFPVSFAEYTQEAAENLMLDWLRNNGWLSQA